ncbi:MAG: nitronate monooxygenase [Dehalococcoidales bacterium]|nr:nitronate monooxygenase [Dehalococcoidales bacterium]
MLKTRVTEMLGIKYPIIAGPMAYISGPELVAAVSNAGGLGVMASLSYPNTQELQQAIRETQKLTKKPFAVNITMLPVSRPVKYEDYFQTAIGEGVRIIETSGRSPEPYMQMLKNAGVTVMHRATRTKDIQTAERVGVDMVTILGTEAAGHPGQEEVGTIVRVPVAVNSVKIPVIAGGGIADGRGFVAALALGAEGVLIGSRFMVSKEANIHDNVKKWLCGLTEADTILIQKSIKNASRVVRNAHTEKVLEMENRGATIDELLPMISGTRGRNAYATGDFSEANISVGQCVGLIRDIPTVKQIIDGIIKDAKVIMKRLQTLGVGS